MNKRIKYIIPIFFILSIPVTLNAQKIVNRDTSYTVYSSYKKYVKKFSGIQIVKSKNFENVTEQTDMVYHQLGNRNLHLDAFIEKSEHQKPVVILIHGGGWKSGNKSHMTPIAQILASRGYACFAVEYRLSPDAPYPAGILDIITAIKYITTNADKYNVDSSRVALLGCSSGGQMAALVGTTYHKNIFENVSELNSKNNIQAIIDLDGILAFKHPESEEGESAAQWLGGSYQENPENWKEASALTHVDKNTPPVLFINSNFKRFHAGRDDMIDRLRKNNIYYEVKEFENSPHTFWLFEPWFTPTVDYITDFLNKLFNK